MYRRPRGRGPPVYVPVASGGGNGIYIYIYILVASGSRRGGGCAGLRRQLLSNRMRNRRQQHLQYAHACFGSRCCTATRKGFPFARKRSSLVRCFGFVCFGFHCFGFCLGTCWLLRLLLLWLRGTGGHGSGIWNSIARSTRKEPCAAKKCGAVNSMSGAR